MSCDNNATNGSVKNDEEGLIIVDNYIGDKFVPPQRLLLATSTPVSTDGCYMDIHNPATSQVIGKVCLSNADDVEAAVEAASTAFVSWSELTIKARAVSN
jgi:acyl-CoA reductase-like NAD-dependent aldehyde dehydrogenase